MIYPAQYFLKEMSQEVGKYSAYNPKCSMQPPHFIPQLSDVKFYMVSFSLGIVNVIQLLRVKTIPKNGEGILVANISLCFQALTYIEYLLNNTNFVVED